MYKIHMSGLLHFPHYRRHPTFTNEMLSLRQSYLNEMKSLLSLPVWRHQIRPYLPGKSVDWFVTNEKEEERRVVINGTWLLVETYYNPFARASDPTAVHFRVHADVITYLRLVSCSHSVVSV